MLKDVIQERDADNLSGPSWKAIEDLGRYVDLFYHSLSTITNDIRTMCNIESVISERLNSIHDLPVCHSGSIGDYLIRQRTELWEILRILNVRDHQLTDHVVSEIKQHVQRSTDTETSMRVSTSVRRFLSLHTTPP